MSTDKIIEATQKAIKESKRPFDKISKDSILEFLKDAGVTDRKEREDIYNTLKKLNNTVQTVVSTVSENKSKDEFTMPIRQPRKNIFGEIKRIA